MEADAPLSVDPNTVLTGTVTPQILQPAARKGGEVPERLRAIKQSEATCGLFGEAMECRDPMALKETARFPILEALDHVSGLYRALRCP